MTTDHPRFGILTAPPKHVTTASDPADVARSLGALLVDVDHETHWTVVDLTTGDQIGGAVDGRRGLPGLLTLLADVAALLADPMTAPRSGYDMWLGHLLPHEIRDLGLPQPETALAIPFGLTA